MVSNYSPTSNFLILKYNGIEFNMNAKQVIYIVTKVSVRVEECRKEVKEVKV